MDACASTTDATVADPEEASSGKRRRCEAEHSLIVDSPASGNNDALEASSSSNAAVSDSMYFEAYADLSVHALMLADRIRVGTYAAALRACRSKFPAGCVVLDVGAGSGVLSMLAAKLAGASRVYAVEAAPGMARLARALIERNGLSDLVRVMEGRAEDVELPEKVDVVVSEWMGFYLLHESMLESVLTARQRWMKPGGLMMPSSARIFAAPVDAEELRSEVDGYANVHGLDLGLFGKAVLEKRCAEPQVEKLDAGRLLAPPELAIDLGDLHTLAPGSTAELQADVSFLATRGGYVAGVAFWFDVGFKQHDCGTPDKAAAQELLLSTAPGAPPTHWQQTVVYLGAFVAVEPGDELPLRLLLRQSDENPRHYDITVETC